MKKILFVAVAIVAAMVCSSAGRGKVVKVCSPDSIHVYDTLAKDSQL